MCASESSQNFENSDATPPSPAPKVTRPRLRTSRVATWCASTCGRRRATGVTAVPTRICSVVAAIADSVTQWIRGGAIPHEREVIPDEDAVPAPCLGRRGYLHRDTRVGVRPDACHADAVAHG